LIEEEKETEELNFWELSLMAEQFFLPKSKTKLFIS
jgi:hypothetical protein